LGGFFENLSRKFNFHYYLTRITDTLHEDVCKCISTGIFLGIKNLSDGKLQVKPKHAFDEYFFNTENCAVSGIMWKKYGKTRQATDDNIIGAGKMRFACRLTKAKLHIFF